MSERECVLCEGGNVLCEGGSVMCEGGSVMCEDESVMCEGGNVLCEGGSVMCEGGSVMCEGVMCESQFVLKRSLVQWLVRTLHVSRQETMELIETAIDVTLKVPAQS